MNRKIAFIGATGLLGRPVAAALAESGFEVAALVRNKTKAKHALPETIRLVPGDLKNENDLAKLMTGCDTVYLNLSITPNERPGDFHAETDGLKRVLEMAKRSDIKRVLYLSSLAMRYQGMNNFHWWVFACKHEAVQRVRECGIPFTIFYPSTFMESIEAKYRRGKRILLAGNSQHRMYFISANDYARQVVRSLQLPGEENREYVVQGPQAFTADEAAAEYIRHYAKERLSIAKAPFFMLRLFSRFSRKVNYGTNILEALNNYPEKFEAADTWLALGVPETTLAMHAQRQSLSA